MKSIRQELVSLVAVLATPAALIAVFPYGVVGFKAIPRQAASKPSAAFVHLTIEEESEALRAAKASWQAGSASDMGMRAYLPLGELPEDGQNGPILDDSVWMWLRTMPAPVEYGTPTWSPSFAADAPAKIAADAEGPHAPTFSKEELLRIEER